MNLPGCRICRSTQFRRTADGRYICKNNHIQGYYEEVSEEYQPGHGLLFKRKFPTSNEQQQPTINEQQREPATSEHQERLHFLFVMQRLLMAQCDQLIKIFGSERRDQDFGVKYKQLVKFLWIWYINSYSGDDVELKKRIPCLSLHTILLINLYGLKCLNVPFGCQEIVEKVRRLEIPFFDIFNHVSSDSLKQLSAVHLHVLDIITFPTAASLNRNLISLHYSFPNRDISYGSLDNFDTFFTYFYTNLVISLYGTSQGQQIFDSIKNRLLNVCNNVRNKYSNFFHSVYKQERCIAYAAVFAFLLKLLCGLDDERRDKYYSHLFDLMLDHQIHKFEDDFSKTKINRNWNLLLASLSNQANYSLADDGIMRDFGRIKSQLPTSAPLPPTSCTFFNIDKGNPVSLVQSYVVYDHSKPGDYHDQFKFLLQTIAQHIGYSVEKLVDCFISVEKILVKE